MTTNNAIARYSKAQTAKHAAICRLLHDEIDAALPKAASKIWHAMPVWFVDENPVVGYKASAKHVNLLFWNGQEFDEPALIAAGKFHAAQIKYTDVSEIDTKLLRRWLKKAGKMVWDYNAMRKGKSKKA